MKYAMTILLFSILVGCETKSEYSEESVTQEIQRVFNDFYSKYNNRDIAFTDYYSDDVIRLAPSGEFTEGVETFREGWKETIENDAFELLSFGEPRFIISREQVVSFNKFDEVFIDPENGDSTRYTGTWVAVWQKQPDDQWKIEMTTWHSGQ